MSNINALKGIPFFYILSIGRPKSMLLKFILGAHPNVKISLESRFIIHFYYKYKSKTNWSKKDKEKKFNNLFKDEKLFIRWDIDKKKEISFITKKIANNYDYNLKTQGQFKLKFIFIKVTYNYFKLRLYYLLSLSIE